MQKNWFRIDYLRLVRLLLPVMLRKPRIVAFVEACISPVDSLYMRFLSYRYDNLYHLSITPQVYSLEKALNDRFDYTLRRIYISKGKHYPLTYLYTQDENLDEYIGKEGEDNNMYIYAGSESGESSASFIINVPVPVPFHEAEMRAMVEMYTVKSFKINII
jgi:hypothetical protein